MRITRKPALSSAIARLATVVLLPSDCTDDVITKVRAPVPMSRNCRLVRSVRNDSARGLRGSTCTISGRSEALLSKAMPPTTGLSLIFSTSCSVRTRLSSVSRRTAMPTPSASPTSRPSATLTGTFGLTGTLGTSACFTRVSLTLLLPSASVASMSSTTLVRLCDVAFAMFAACTGSVSFTLIEIRVVLVGAVADTIVASWSAFMSSWSFEMTGSSTIGVDTRFEYVRTRCWVKVFP